MLAFPAGFKIYLAVAPVDMRKQFNGLWAVLKKGSRPEWRLVRPKHLNSRQCK